MRAVLIPNFEFEDSILLQDKDILHHLLNVIRLKKNEKVLLLNGMGTKRTYIVNELAKKSIALSADNEKISEQRKYNFDLLISQPKKEAFDLSIKMATQIGVREIFVWQSDYSQNYSLNISRLEKIMKSACEQSNNLFLPKITPINFDQLEFKNYQQIYFLNSQSDKSDRLQSRDHFLLVVGPEGGFSPSEFEYFNKLENSSSLFLPTPILRTETAVSFGLGYVISVT